MLAIHDILQVGGAIDSNDTLQQKRKLKRIVSMLTKLGQRSDFVGVAEDKVEFGTAIEHEHEHENEKSQQVASGDGNAAPHARRSPR